MIVVIDGLIRAITGIAAIGWLYVGNVLRYDDSDIFVIF